MTTRRVFTIFVVAQVLGEFFFWTWPVLPDALSSVAWGASFLLLLPGNQIGSMLVEHFFWGKLTQEQLALMAVPVELIVNSIVWGLVVLACRALLGRRTTARSS